MHFFNAFLYMQIVVDQGLYVLQLLILNALFAVEEDTRPSQYLNFGTTPRSSPVCTKCPVCKLKG